MIHGHRDGDDDHGGPAAADRGHVTRGHLQVHCINDGGGLAAVDHCLAGHHSNRSRLLHQQCMCASWSA